MTVWTVAEGVIIGGVVLYVLRAVADAIADVITDRVNRGP